MAWYSRALAMIGIGSPRTITPTKTPPIGRPLTRRGSPLGRGGWRQYMDGILRELQPPEWLTYQHIGAMRRSPTLADCEQTRRAILADTLFTAACPGSDVAQRMAQDMVDQLMTQALLGSRHFRYGGALAQVLCELRDLEIEVVEFGGTRVEKLPQAYWPAKLRWLRVNEPSMQILVDRNGDLAGCTFGGRSISGPAFFALVHGDEDGSGVCWESAYHDSWTPWAANKRILTHLVMYTTQKGNPPGKAFVPSNAEYDAMQKTGEGDDPEPEDVGDWMGDQLQDLWGGGFTILPSMYRSSKETGAVEPTRMFDFEYLQVPARADEFDKAMTAMRLLMIEAWHLGLPEGAQSAMKQGTRNLFVKLKLDAQSVAQQFHDRLVRPYLELNLGPDVPPSWITPGMVAENRRELMGDLVKTFAAAKQKLADGREVSMESWLDLEHTLRAAGATTRDRDLAAMKVDTSEVARPAGRPRTDPGAKPFDSDDPEEEQRAA